MRRENVRASLESTSCVGATLGADSSGIAASWAVNDDRAHHVNLMLLIWYLGALSGGRTYMLEIPQCVGATLGAESSSGVAAG